MPIQVWNCEKCHAQWTDKAAAERCESLHKVPVEYTPISWVKYTPETRPSAMERAFPDRIKVRIALEGVDALIGFDTATYMLERIGPKGL